MPMAFLLMADSNLADQMNKGYIWNLTIYSHGKLAVTTATENLETSGVVFSYLFSEGTVP